MTNRVKLIISMCFLMLSVSAFAKDADIGQNYYIEELKNKNRTIASEEPVVAKPSLDVDAVEPADEHEEDNERSVASEVEQEPSSQGVKFWKFKP